MYGATLKMWPDAELQGEGESLVSSAQTRSIALLEGFVNTTKIEVTAQDGVTKKLYTMQIFRGKSPDDALSSLAISEGPGIEPQFDRLVTDYQTVLPNPCFTCDGGSVPTFTITPSASHWGAKISVGKDTVKEFSKPGSASPPIALLEGATTKIPIKVIAQDGVSKTVTTFTVTRDPSPDSAL